MRSFDTSMDSCQLCCGGVVIFPVSKLYLPFTVLIQPFQTAMDASTPILAIQTYSLQMPGVHRLDGLLCTLVLTVVNGAAFGSYFD